MRVSSPDGKIIATKMYDEGTEQWHYRVDAVEGSLTGMPVHGRGCDFCDFGKLPDWAKEALK